MAKKKKSVAESLLRSSKEKLLKQVSETVTGEDAESKQSTIRAGLKGNKSKAVKQAIKSVKSENTKSQKTALQAVLTGTPQKALKQLVQEPFRQAEIEHKRLNKEFRKQRNLLYRRIKYLESKGFHFENQILPDALEGNATQEEIEMMKSLRVAELKNLATSFTPPTPAEVPTVVEPEDFTNVVEPEPEPDEEIDDWEMSEEELQRTRANMSKFGDAERERLEEETPQERYYRENEDREYDRNASVERGELILNNIYAEINVNQRIFLDDKFSQDSEQRFIKQDAAVRIADALSKAEDYLGHDMLCYVLELNAADVKHAITIALYYFDSKDETRTEMETESALTELTTILFSNSPALLMDMQFGNPENI